MTQPMNDATSRGSYATSTYRGGAGKNHSGGPTRHANRRPKATPLGARTRDRSTVVR